MITTPKIIHKYNELFFDLSIATIYIFIFLSYLIQINVKGYINTIHYYVNIYVCLFLIIRFNPFRRDNIVLNNLDRKIAFNAGIIILTTTILNTYLEHIKTFLSTTIMSMSPI